MTTRGWDTEGELYQPRPRESASAVQSVRFTRAELRAIRRAASEAGVSASEFIRRAAMREVVGAEGWLTVTVHGTRLQGPGTSTAGSVPPRVPYIDELPLSA